MNRHIVGIMSLLLVAVPASYGIVVGDFEAGLDGWWTTSGGTLSQSDTGATTGTKALQVDMKGGWKMAAQLDAKPHMAILSVEGTSISADITVSSQGETWMNSQVVINAQNNDNNGANNNIGWRQLPSLDLLRDGSPHNYKWTLDAELAGDISGADASIAWFELVIVVNNDLGDANSVKVNIDNIQINEPTKTLSIGDFEKGLDTWAPVNWDAATLTQVTTTGATVGTHAMRVENAAGGWHPGAIYNVKPYRTMFGSPGAVVTMDVTAFTADMSGGWFNVGMVLNAQNNDDNGANNNIGWVDLGGRDVAGDGQPHTLVWELPADLIAKIALTDDTIGWFEILFVSNNNSSVTKYYVDNIRIGPAPEKEASQVFGDWENQADGWVPITTQVNAVDYTPVMEYGAVGATLNQSSLKVTIPDQIFQSNTWWQPVMRVFPRDIAGMEQAFLQSRSMKIDLTRLASEWIAGADTHSQILMIINAGGPDWSVWAQSPGLGWWTPANGDATWTLEWDYSGVMPNIRSDLGFWWLEIWIVAQISKDYTGTKALYFDNFNFPVLYKAHDPIPGKNATGVDRQSALSWTAGVDADSHDVYFSADSTALSSVNRDNLAEYPQVTYLNTTDTTFTPGDLDLSTTYYWRIDEYAISDSNEVTITKGDIWSFTVSNNILVEDFESYLNWPDLRAKWTDANDLVTDPVFAGKQAMKTVFDNRTAPYYTEISYALPAELKDMTQGDVRRMTLNFFGDPNTPPEAMYALLEDGQGASDIVFYEGDLANLSKPEWQVWDVPLARFDNVNRKEIVRIAFGFGNPLSPAPGGFNGTVYFDDVRLYQGECLLNKRTADFARIDFMPLGVIAGDCQVNAAELIQMAADWLMKDSVLPAGTTDPNSVGGLLARYLFDEGTGATAANDTRLREDGTLVGGASWITPGYNGSGNAIRFNGTGNSRVSIGTWDPSEDTGQLTLSLWIRWAGDRVVEHQGIIGKRSAWDSTNAMRWFLETDPLGRLGFRQYWEAGVDLYSANGVLDPFVGHWVHVAVTFDQTTARIYLNGAEIASGPFVLADMPTANMGIGNTHGGGSGETFIGDIDEVQIYNRALSALEVAYLADLTPGDGQVNVPIASPADISSDEPAGQKSINLSDFAVLASFWLEDQTWPY